MKRKILWLFVSCLMALSLVLASCAPAVTEEEEVVVEEEEEEEEVVEEEEEEEEEVEGMPKYGGTFTFALYEARLTSWIDAVYGSAMWTYPNRMIMDRYLVGDWTKGPAGTNESSFTQAGRLSFSLLTGGSCESYELEGDTLIWHVRQGMHFALNPDSEASRLVGGREVVAEDFAYSLRRLWLAPKSYMATNRPWKKFFVEVDEGPSIIATDKYTFEMRMLPGYSYDIYKYMLNQWGYELVPREVVEKYGDMNEWENAVGMGPFMLVDCVPGSSWSFERNPDYWMKDPVGPGKGNQLPYLDGVKLLEIYDASTRLAGLRTGKIDWMKELFWEDMDSLRKTSPEMDYQPYSFGNTMGLWFRVDKPEIPLYDIRVRRALLMAFDNPTVLETYYGGDGQILTFPSELPEYRDFGYALDEYPEEIRELFEYHPDKAKALLAEAGYPNGFKTSVVCPETDVDALSIIAAYWKDVLNVDLELQVYEYAVYTNITRRNKAHDQMCTYLATAFYQDSFMHGEIGSVHRYSGVNDQQLIDGQAAVEACGWDQAKRFQTYKEQWGLRFTSLVLGLQFPAPNRYVFWWPWLKNYHGELELGYCNFLAWTRFIWIDQDMKEAMVGAR